MCRFFAVRSSVPLNLAAPLVESPTSLVAQSCCDRRGESHGDGWGIAALEGSKLRVHRSTLPARDDARFAALATSLTTTLAIAHVRQASVGQISPENTHPFAHGRWVFAHNGTLQDFDAGRARLLAEIPADLQAHIAGSTDSEHIFYLLLGKLRTLLGSIDDVASGDVPSNAVPSTAAATVDSVSTALKQTVQLLDARFPTHEGEETKLNFLLTDGRLLAATRWKHSLHVLDQSGASAGANRPRAVLIASEPTDGGPWQPVAERSLLVVDEQLRIYSSALDA